MNNLHHPDKKEFQVERIVFFSDALFAIAITVLIINVKVPQLSSLSITEQAFWEQSSSLIPQLLGFLISFFIIGLYWSIHHRMFGYVVDYNGKLIWLNLFFLFSIVLMPFSTAVYSTYSTQGYIILISPYAIYVVNICLTGLLNFILWAYLGNPNNHLTEGLPGGDFLKKAKIRSLLLPSVFVLSLLVAVVIDPIIGRFVLFLLPVFMGLVRNKTYQHQENVRSTKQGSTQADS